MITSARARGWSELTLVAIGFALSTALITYPLAFHLGTLARLDNADARFLIWNIAWVARTLVVDPLHVLDANIFYPHRGTLAYSEANLGAGLLAVPIYWLTGNPYAAHNFVTLISFVLSGVATYYLVRYLVGDRRAAVIAAIGFAYCPYLFGRLPHIHLLMTAGLPLSLLALHRLADRPTPGRGAQLGLSMAAQALFCGYYAVFVTLTIGYAVLVIATLRHWWTNARYWWAIGVAAVLSLVLAIPLFWPYLRLQRDAGFVRTLDEARLWSADWQAYLASSASLHGWILPLIGRWNEVLFPGFVVLLAGAAGLVVAWRTGTRRRELGVLYGGLGLMAVWTSFGPDAGLYRLFHETLPAFSLLRAPSRFGVVVALALAVLAGVSIAGFFERLDRQCARWVPGLVAAMLTVGTLVELRVPLSFSPVPATETAYRVLATLPKGPVLEIPVYSYEFSAERTRYMLGSTAHWMPLVVGYSSHTPRRFADQVDVLAGFPSREAFNLLHRDRVRYAVFHMHVLTPEMRDDLTQRLESFNQYLVRRYLDDRIWIYEIVGSPS